MPIYDYTRMNMKKIKSLLLSLLLILTAVSIVGCKTTTTKQQGDGLEGSYNVTLWVSEIAGVDALFQGQVDAFELANPGIIINATIEGVSEAESATQMVTSVEDGADIYCFAQDQLARLAMAGALNKLGTATAAQVASMNDSGAVAAASVGGSLYCYPLTSDNGYMMFYDKSVIASDHIDSLEEIIADCEASGKKFSFNLEGSGWYNASFFFATGCHSNWTTNEAGEFTAIDDDFNSAKGLIALKGMQKLLKSSCYINSNSAGDFSAAVPSAVVISGTWDINTAKTALGENFAVSELPSFTVGEKTYHLGSYAGNKLMGVKPTVDAKRAAVLQKLALYLSGEECQLERFSQLGWGPSNKVVQGKDEVKANIALAALAAQSPYSIPQGQIHGSWWDISKLYAVTAKTATTDAELEQALVDYKAAVDGLFTMPAEEKDAFTVIGSMNDDGWASDLAMVQKPEGTWWSKAILFVAGDKFKVRQGKSWDVAFGDDGGDFEVSEAGYYFVKLVYDKTAGTGIVTLEKNSPIDGWTVIGSMNEDGWASDLQMEIQADGSFLSSVLTFVVDDEFKVRQGKSWDVAYGDGSGNYIVKTAGSFKVKLSFVDSVATVELVAVE